MASIVSICNMALGSLGAGLIASLDERRPEAIYCKLLYDEARKGSLRDHPWNFAQARATLAPVAVPDGWAASYDYAFAKPARCVTITGFYDGAGVLVGADWELGVTVDDVGQEMDIILSNTDAAIVQYTLDRADPERFDPLFVRALAARLAADLVGPLKQGDAQSTQTAESKYRSFIAAAKARDANEGKPETATSNPWLDARVLPDGFVR